MRARPAIFLLLPLLMGCDSTPIFRASPRALPGGELIESGPLPGRPATDPPAIVGDIWTRELPGDDATFEVAPGEVDAVFDAAREIFRDHGFSLARVDVAGGVLSTWARQSAGVATPHHKDESTFGESMEGLFNAQRRRVRLTFEPLEEGGARPSDYRAAAQPLIARVRVVVERLNTQGRAPSAISIRRSAYYVDATRSGPQDIATPLRRDGALAGRLAEEIQARASFSGESTSANSPDIRPDTP